MAVAQEHLAQLDIPLRSRIGNLSGGQQAQVALTLCLAKEPELLLLDEPAAALDPVARDELLRILMRQVADCDSSVLLSTHSLRRRGGHLRLRRCARSLTRRLIE